MNDLQMDFAADGSFSGKPAAAAGTQEVLDTIGGVNQLAQKTGASASQVKSAASE